MWIIFILITAVLLGLDQWSKWVALQKLSDYATGVRVPNGIGDPIPGVPHVFEFVYKSNTAGAMGINFPLARQILSVLTVVLLVVLAVYVVKKGKKRPLLWSAVALICAGGIGNLVDRVFRGYVPDFIRFVHNAYFPYVFNVADIYICIGAVLLGIFILCAEDNKTLKRSDSDGGDVQSDS